MTANLHRLAYMSSALNANDSSIYRDIANASAVYNSAVEITGMLLINNGLITQILEGPQFEVESLYSRIEKDSRHINPIILLQENITEREFPNWSMGFDSDVIETDARVIYRLTSLTLSRLTPSHLSKQISALIASFSKTSGLSAVG